MKKSLLIISALVISTTSCMVGWKKEAIDIQSLPTESQRVINSCFTDCKVTGIIKETELAGIEYDVRFNDGSEVDFDSNGIWKKIDCRMTSVPEKLIPAEILDKVRQSFPGASVSEIEKNRRGFDVELDNGIDLKFDKAFNMSIDD